MNISISQNVGKILGKKVGLLFQERSYHPVSIANYCC